MNNLLRYVTWLGDLVGANWVEVVLFKNRGDEMSEHGVCVFAFRGPFLSEGRDDEAGPVVVCGRFGLLRGRGLTVRGRHRWSLRFSDTDG